MQDQQYLFKDFDLLPDKNNGALFYSPEMSAHLKNKNLIALLHEVKLNKIILTLDSSLNFLIEKHNLQDTSIKDYLTKELKVISMLDEKRFKNIFFQSDDIVIKNTLHEYFSSRFSMNTFSQLDESKLNESSVIFLFNSVYCPKDFDKVYALADKYQAWVITAYVANHFLIIDNIYNPRKGMPCHFCNFHRHQNLVMSKNSLKKSSWVNYSRRAMIEGIDSLPAMRFTAIERGISTFWLAKKIRSFINPHAMSLTAQDVSRYDWINLITGEVNNEQSVHWIDCQCRSSQ